MITLEVVVIIRDTGNGNHYRTIRGEKQTIPPLMSVEQAAKFAMASVVETIREQPEHQRRD